MLTCDVVLSLKNLAKALAVSWGAMGVPSSVRLVGIESWFRFLATLTALQIPPLPGPSAARLTALILLFLKKADYHF